MLALALLLFPLGFKLFSHKLSYSGGFLEPTPLRQGEHTYYIHSQRSPLKLFLKLSTVNQGTDEGP